MIMAEPDGGESLSFLLNGFDMTSGLASDVCMFAISCAGVTLWSVVGVFGMEGFVLVPSLSFLDFITASNSLSDLLLSGFGYENSVGKMTNAANSDTETQESKSRAAWLRLPFENILPLTFLKTAEATLLRRR